LPDKVDVGFLVIVAFSALLTVILYDFTDLTTRTTQWATIIYFLVLVGPLTFIFLFPAYWAFDIRRALAVRLYRNQALGIALVSVGFFVFGIVVSTLVTYDLALLIIFYWLDSSVLAARRSDPLLRDTLHWTRLRIVVWALVLIGLGVSTAFVLINGDITYIPSDVVGMNLATLPDFAVPLVALVLLPLVARRSKDHALRRHISWFGVFAVLQFAAILGATVLGGASYFVGFAFGGYCLFRSARALVPLNRFSLVELSSPMPKETSVRPNTDFGRLGRTTMRYLYRGQSVGEFDSTKSAG
jgi:hypothetical protein